MKKFISVIASNTSFYIYGIFFVFSLWFLISISQGLGNLVFPTPVETFIKTGELLSSSYIYKCIGWTTLRTLIGFSISFLSALILGLFAGSFKKVQTFLKPLMIVLKSAPTAAFVFLFLIISGSKYAPIYIVIILAFPILYESVVGGLSSIGDEINDALKVDSGRFFISFFKVKLPLSLRYITVGLASSFALSFKTAIMAEIIAGDTNYGLGSAITSYRNSEPANLTPIFAITLIAITIILIVDLLSYIVKRKVEIN